jgi:hypothetical protein
MKQKHKKQLIYGRKCKKRGCPGVLYKYSNPEGKFYLQCGTCGEIQ